MVRRLQPDGPPSVVTVPVGLPAHDPALAQSEHLSQLLLDGRAAELAPRRLSRQNKHPLAQVDEVLRLDMKLVPEPEPLDNRAPHLLAPTPAARTSLPRDDLGPDARELDLGIEHVDRGEIALAPSLIQPAQKLDRLSRHRPSLPRPDLPPHAPRFGYPLPRCRGPAPGRQGRPLWRGWTLLRVQ